MRFALKAIVRRFQATGRDEGYRQCNQATRPNRPGRKLVAAGMMALAAGPLFAQASDRTVKIVVPYPAGGVADALARTVAAPLGAELGQTVVVENKPGAAGTIGAALVKNAKPDGTTLLFTNVGPTAIAPAMSKTATYDPVKDFRAVSLVSRSPLVLIVPAASGAKDVRSLVEAAKQNPGAIAYSSAGVGSFGHLSMELFSQAVGAQFLHVPYQGLAPATLALMTGEVKLMMGTPSSQIFQSVQEGKLRLLAVASDKPSALVPGVPSITDAVPGFNAEYWFGIVAPAGTSDAAVARLHAAFQKVLADPDTARRFHDLGNEVARASAAEFQKLIEAEVQRWRRVIKAANLP